MAGAAAAGKMEVDPATVNTSIGNTSSEEQSFSDGYHLKRFRAAVDQCIDKCLKLDMKVFARHYNPVWKNNKEALEALIFEVIAQAKDKLRERLESAFINEDIPNLLSLMDEILEESKQKDDTRVAWRPTGDPEADSRAYFMALKKRKLQELETELQKMQNEEKIFKEDMLTKRGRLISTEAEIKGTYEKEKTTVVDKATEFQTINDSFNNSFVLKSNRDQKILSKPATKMET